MRRWSARAGLHAVLFAESADPPLDQLASMVPETLPDRERPDPLVRIEPGDWVSDRPEPGGLEPHHRDRSDTAAAR